MSKITSIEELIQCFDHAEPGDQAGILKNIDISKFEFEKYATWEAGSNGYTRNCIVRKGEFEFILLCWNVGACTPIHGHDGQNCWVYQVSGSVREKRYKETDSGLQICNDMALREGKFTFMHDHMGYHSIENISDNLAMTLHIYAKPIDSCRVYDPKKSEFVIQELNYDTIDESFLKQVV